MNTPGFNIWKFKIQNLKFKITNHETTRENN